MRNAFVSLRNACNAKCPMCLSWKSTEALDGEVVDQILRALSADRWETVTFTGGEFVEHPAAESAIQTVEHLGMDIAFITNGTALEPQYSTLRSVDSLKKVIYSRDFATGDHHADFRSITNTDSTITETLLGLSASGVSLQVNTVLMPGNVRDLQLFADLPFWPAVDRWHLIPVKGAMAGAWTIELWAEAIETIEDLRNDLPIAVDGPDKSWQPLDLDALKTGRYTTHLVAGEAGCGVIEDVVYFDASGAVMPCNSVSWEFRGACSYGNVNTEHPATILARRKQRLRSGTAQVADACYACDPANVAVNLARR